MIQSVLALSLIRSVIGKSIPPILSHCPFLFTRSGLEPKTFENFHNLLLLTTLFDGSSNAPASANQASGNNQNKPSKGIKKVESPILMQFEGIVNALKSSDSLDFIGEILANSNIQAVVTVRTDFFSQSGMPETIDGEFRVLGKVTRVLRTSDDEPIDLLRKTVFGTVSTHLLTQPILDNLSNLQSVGFKPTDLVTSISYPSLMIIPIAIFA